MNSNGFTYRAAFLLTMGFSIAAGTPLLFSSSEASQPPLTIHIRQVQKYTVRTSNSATAKKMSKIVHDFIRESGVQGLPRTLNILTIPSNQTLRDIHLEKIGKLTPSKLGEWKSMVEEFNSTSNEETTPARIERELTRYFCDTPLTGPSILHRIELIPLLGHVAFLDRWKELLKSPYDSFLSKPRSYLTSIPAVTVAHPQSECGWVVLFDTDSLDPDRHPLLHEVTHWMEVTTRPPELTRRGFWLLPTVHEAIADMGAALYLKNPCYLTLSSVADKECSHRFADSSASAAQSIRIDHRPYSIGPNSLRAYLWSRLSKLPFPEATRELWRFRDLVSKLAADRASDPKLLEAMNRTFPIASLQDKEFAERLVQLEEEVVRSAIESWHATKPNELESKR